VRVIIAIALTLVAAFSGHVTRAFACDRGADACCCCAEHEEAPRAALEQRIAPICGCSIESAPEHLPAPLPGVITSVPARTAPEPMLALAWSPAPDRPRVGIDTQRSPRPPNPARSLLAQKTSLLV
jgi:hypothetical protein